MNTRQYTRAASIAAIIITLGYASPTSADHSWGGYHWARTSNPFTVQLGDNLTASWKPFLVTASSDWTASSVLDTTIVAGKGGLSCRAASGRVEVCNRKYGSNGWLGIATIWTSSTHITQATVKMNDTYFSRTQYNTVAWKNLVMCQEIGHTFGLDHQDETHTNGNLGTCMDYTNSPSTNQHPNQHDYDMLEQIYAHLDTTTTLATVSASKPATDSDSDDPRRWGREVARSRDGRVSLYEEDLGNGEKIFRHVFWAEEAPRTRSERPPRE